MLNITIFLMLSLAAYATCGDSDEHNNEGDGKKIAREDLDSSEESPPFECHDLVINGIKSPGVFLGAQDINIDRTSNEVKVNDKKVPEVNGNIKLSIKYHKNGGITVNGDKIEGFENIIGKGCTFFGYTPNPTHYDGAGSFITIGPSRRYTFHPAHCDAGGLSSADLSSSKYEDNVNSDICDTINVLKEIYLGTRD